MFRPKKMKKVRIVLLKSVVEQLIRDLHEAGLVDIKKTKYDGLDEGRPLGAFDEISTELLKLRSISTILEKATGKLAMPPAGQIPLIDGRQAMAQSRSFDLDGLVLPLSQELASLDEQIKLLESDLALVKKISHFKKVDFSHLNTKRVSYRLGELPGVKLPGLRQRLDSIGETTLVGDESNQVVLVLLEESNANAVESALSDFGFAEFELPTGTTTPEATIAKLGADLEQKVSRRKIIFTELKSLAGAHTKTLATLIASLEAEAAKAEIAERFSSSKSLYVIQGWIIAADFEKLHSLLGKYQNQALLEDVPCSHEEMPPTVLDNPKIASPFDFITNSYSLPNYFELDPTIMYMVALPILYGMIVGDVLYGVMSILIALWLMKKFEKSYIMYNVSKIWLYSAIPTIFFGLIFDEWAGMTHFHLAETIGKWLGMTLLSAPLYVGFTRIESVLALIGISALAGLIHLAIGFIMGAINEWNHNKTHALAKLAWVGVELGLTLALLPFLPSMLPELGFFPPAISTLGLVILVISVIVLGVTEGILGIIEVPGLVGNILSYSRIAAIGIVGVVIAELLNEFLVPLPTQGILAFVLLPVFLILHVVNCFVAMFESLIQGGRLNLVEFRSKFMHGGGGVFTPFALYSKKL